LAAAGAKSQGVEGVVIDGACRDIDEIRKLGLWLASRHIAPTTGKGRLKLLPIGVPVTVGGVHVEQDDLVVGDETGIIVVPRRMLGDVLPRAEKLLAADQAVEERMQVGMSFSAAGAASGYLPPEKS
jgi:regulator of RNase E activity RraA